MVVGTSIGWLIFMVERRVAAYSLSGRMMDWLRNGLIMSNFVYVVDDGEIVTHKKQRRRGSAIRAKHKSAYIYNVSRPRQGLAKAGARQGRRSARLDLQLELRAEQSESYL